MKNLPLTAVIAFIVILSIAGSLYAAGDAHQVPDSRQDMGVSQNMQSQDINRPGGALDQPTGAIQDQVSTTQMPSADQLNGMKVFSPSGDKIGKISEVNKGEQSGKLNYVTLSKGGFLGIGGEDVAVPLEAFRFDNDRAILTVDPGKLDNAPKQANRSDEQFQKDLQSYYGVSPAWQNSKNIDSKSTDAIEKSAPTYTPGSRNSLKNSSQPKNSPDSTNY